MSGDTHLTNLEAKHSNGRSVSRWPEVEKRVKRSRAQVWRDIQAGKFPAPIQIGPNSVAWFDDEIDRWLAERPRVTYGPSEAA